MNQKPRLYILEIRTRHGQIMYLTAVKTLLSVFLNISTLGFWFNEHFGKSVTEVTKAAGRALGAVYIKYLYAGGKSYEVYTKLIESVVEPVLFYCSGIWGTCFPKVQRVLNKTCQYFLRASKKHQTLLPGAIGSRYLLKLSSRLNVFACAVG